MRWARVNKRRDNETRCDDIDNDITKLDWTEGGATSDLDLNAYVQMNDIIEFRSSPDDIPRRGKITSIGSMKDDMILKLNNGSWLSRSEHQVKRLEVARDTGNGLLVNPNPQWRHLSDVWISTTITRRRHVPIQIVVHWEGDTVNVPDSTRGRRSRIAED